MENRRNIADSELEFLKDNGKFQGKFHSKPDIECQDKQKRYKFDMSFLCLELKENCKLLDKCHPSINIGLMLRYMEKDIYRVAKERILYLQGHTKGRCNYYNKHRH